MSEIYVAMLYILRRNSGSLRKAIVSCVGDADDADEARQDRFESTLRA